MALTLVFQENTSFYVEDQRFMVINIHEDGGCTVVDTKGKKTDIDRGGYVELLPNVRITESFKNLPHETKLVFDAPRSIEILRENLYERNKVRVQVKD